MWYTTKNKTKNQKQKKECACVHTCVQTGERGGDKARPSTADSTHPVEGKRTGRSHAGWKTKSKKQNMKKKNTTKKKTITKTKKARACVHTEERVETERAQAP